MMRRQETAGIWGERPSLAVYFSDDGCRQRPTIDANVVGDFDMLSGKCCDRLDQRRNSAGTQPSP